jgi:hypothetical protein
MGMDRDSDIGGKVLTAISGLKIFFQKNAEAMKRVHSMNSEMLLKFGVTQVRTADMEGVMFAIEGKFEKLIHICFTPNFYSKNNEE